MRVTERGTFGTASGTAKSSSFSSPISMPWHSFPRNPAHSMGTTGISHSRVIASHTATMLSPTTSGPQADITNR